jgi:hypothetical protein
MICSFVRNTNHPTTNPLGLTEGPTHGGAGQDFKTGVHLAIVASEALCRKLLARTQSRTCSFKMGTSVHFGVLALWRRGPRVKPGDSIVGADTLQSLERPRSIRWGAWRTP